MTTKGADEMRDVLAHSAWWIEEKMRRHGVTTPEELRAILEAEREKQPGELKEPEDAA